MTCVNPDRPIVKLIQKEKKSPTFLKENKVGGLTAHQEGSSESSSNQGDVVFEQGKVHRPNNGKQQTADRLVHLRKVDLFKDEPCKSVGGEMDFSVNSTETMIIYISTRTLILVGLKT